MTKHRYSRPLTCAAIAATGALVANSLEQQFLAFLPPWLRAASEAEHKALAQLGSPSYGYISHQQYIQSGLWGCQTVLRMRYGLGMSGVCYSTACWQTGVLFNRSTESSNRE